MQPDQRQDQRRLGDFAGTVVFLLFQAFLIRATLFLIGSSPLSIKSCAFVACANQQWADRAVGAASYGGIALLMSSVALSVWRLVRARFAFAIALVGCVLQLVLGGIALVMANMAGPPL